MKIFLDTNVIINFYSRKDEEIFSSATRQRFYSAGKSILSFCIKSNVAYSLFKACLNEPFRKSRKNTYL